MVDRAGVTVIRLVFGSLDKAPANGLYRAAKAAGLAVEASTPDDKETYTRQFLHGNSGRPDPEYRKPVYIVRIDGPRDVLAGLLDDEAGAALLAGRTVWTLEGGRAWWAT